MAVVARSDGAKRILLAWIKGWPNVEEWRFQIDYEAATHSMEIRSTRLGDDGKLWTAHDRLQMQELESARDLETMVALRAASRHRSLMEAVAAVAVDDEKESE